MHIPQPIRDQFVSPARLVTMPLLTLGYVFGVLQFGVYGFLVVTIALLGGVSAALWADAGRLESNLRSTQGTLSSREEELRSQQRQLDELEEEAGRVLELEAENLSLEEDLAETRSQLMAPQTNLRLLQHSLDFHVRIIDLVQKHRALKRDGFAEWPALSISSLADGPTIAVVAHVEPSSERLANEPVSLVNTATGWVEGNGVIALAEEQRIQARFDFGTVAPQLSEALETEGHVAPDNYSVRLSGLTLLAWLPLDDQRLAELRERLRELSRTLAGTVAAETRAEVAELDAGQPTTTQEEQS